jgi:hypothetical protein
MGLCEGEMRSAMRGGAKGKVTANNAFERTVNHRGFGVGDCSAAQLNR